MITAEVPQIYMHQFWNTITKIKDTDAYSFKLDKKKCRVDTEVFCEILQICPRILNQDFIAPPSEEDLVTFIQELGYSGRCNMLSAIHIDQIHQPWRTYVAIINRCISGKTTGLYRLRESRAQILRDIKDSSAYKTYYDFATGKVPPRKARKYKKVASPPRKLYPVKEVEPVKKAKRVKRPVKKSTTAPTTGVVIRNTSNLMNQPRTISDMWVGLLERNLDGMDECIMECVKTNGTTNPSPRLGEGVFILHRGRP
ncbi:hypothetical protein Tco_1165544 [Tanacetum coccineum]